MLGWTEANHDCLLAKIQTGHLLNINQKECHLNQLSGLYCEIILLYVQSCNVSANRPQLHITHPDVGSIVKISVSPSYEKR
jgi:hypothetical protein